jgi:hypothetical protein
MIFLRFDNEVELEEQVFNVGDVVMYMPQRRTATVVGKAFLYLGRVPTLPVSWHDLAIEKKQSRGTANVDSFELVRRAEPAPEPEPELSERESIVI